LAARNIAIIIMESSECIWTGIGLWQFKTHAMPKTGLRLP